MGFRFILLFMLFLVGCGGKKSGDPNPNIEDSGTQDVEDADNGDVIATQDGEITEDANVTCSLHETDNLLKMGDFETDNNSIYDFWSVNVDGDPIIWTSNVYEGQHAFSRDVWQTTILTQPKTTGEGYVIDSAHPIVPGNVVQVTLSGYWNITSTELMDNQTEMDIWLCGDAIIQCETSVKSPLVHTITINDLTSGWEYFEFVLGAEINSEDSLIPGAPFYSLQFAGYGGAPLVISLDNLELTAIVRECE